MKCIIGLGNPGDGYARTRHNTGYYLVEKLSHAYSEPLKLQSKFKAAVGTVTDSGQKLLFVQPTTFYNLSGEAARSLRDFYKFENSDILVIHDELALPFGTIRARIGGSDAGNNGIKSLTQHLGQDYARLRVGIGSPLATVAAATDFVLGRFTQEEQSQLDGKLLDITKQYVDQFLDGRLEAHTSVAS
ncbi:aminoacyl-tRNA hydrolase [Candidatus Saccharibacteria bacterium]|nr:aminoacyl-tRNA hydrolase [Candidatus Saccharibacteria bacterium]